MNAMLKLKKVNFILDDDWISSMSIKMKKVDRFVMML